MTRISVLVGAIALLAACNDVRPRPVPTTPSTVTSPAPPPPAPPRTFTVSGIVKAGGMPVQGAAVVIVDRPSPPALTGGNGFYTISGVAASVEFSMSPLLSAYKPGYFTDVKFANPSFGPLTDDTTLDFTLDPVKPVAVGDAIRGRLDGSEPYACSNWGYGTHACQRFAVAVDRTGILEATLTTPEFQFDVDIVGPDGNFALYDPVWAAIRRFTIPVTAGSTYEIRLVGGCCKVREFELTTGWR